MHRELTRNRDQSVSNGCAITRDPLRWVPRSGWSWSVVLLVAAWSMWSLRATLLSVSYPSFIQRAQTTWFPLYRKPFSCSSMSWLLTKPTSRFYAWPTLDLPTFIHRQRVCHETASAPALLGITAVTTIAGRGASI